MMKQIYIGLTALSLVAVCGSAQAGEQAIAAQTYYVPQVAQPYNVAYNVDRRAVQQKRIIRVIKTEAPRARMINGHYQLPATQQTTRRRIVTKPVKAMPNLYASVAPTSTPILFDQTAMKAR